MYNLLSSREGNLISCLQQYADLHSLKFFPSFLPSFLHPYLVFFIPPTFLPTLILLFLQLPSTLPFPSRPPPNLYFYLSSFLPSFLFVLFLFLGVSNSLLPNLEGNFSSFTKSPNIYHSMVTLSTIIMYSVYGGILKKNQL